MKLPNAERAVVAREKITEYLLLLTHPEGESKARFFRGFGFRSDEWEALAEALQSHCQRFEVAEIEETPHGRSPLVKAVWQIDRNAAFPRLVTAYPTS